MLYDIELTPSEFLLATTMGTQRMTASVGRNHNTGNRRRTHLERMGDEIRSMCVELAWHKACGTYFNTGINQFMSEPDTNGVEHKTLRDPGGRMPIRPTDKRERTFVCSYTDGNTVKFLGWLRGYEVQDSWLANPGNASPAWFVPQNALHPISKLPPPLLPARFNPEKN